MATQKKKMPVGCWVAIAVTLFVVVVCGGLATWLGWAAYNNPDVQRAMSIGGAALEMARDAQTQPGAAELRSAGCVQALVLTPELLERFASTFGPDGGTEGLPEIPIVTCATRGASDLTCSSVARTYLSAVESPPAEVAVTLQVQGSRQAQCQGIYDAQGELVREFGAQESQFGQIGQGQAPPPPAP